MSTSSRRPLLARIFMASNVRSSATTTSTVPTVNTGRQDYGNPKLRRHQFCKLLHLGHCGGRSFRSPLHGGSPDLARVGLEESIGHRGPHDRGHQAIRLGGGRGTCPGDSHMPSTYRRCVDRPEWRGPERRVDVAGEQPCVELLGALREVDPLIEPLQGVTAERCFCVDEDHRLRNEDVSFAAGLRGPATGCLRPYGQDVTAHCCSGTAERLIVLSPPGGSLDGRPPLSQRSTERATLWHSAGRHLGAPWLSGPRLLVRLAVSP